MNDKEYRVLDEEKNKRTKNAFYIVVCIITLLVAIIGASFSYFIATTTSEDSAVNTGSTSFSLLYKEDDNNLLNPDLIPADNNVVFYSVVKQDYMDDQYLDDFREYVNQPGSAEYLTLKNNIKNTKCRDDNGNAVCSLYTFTVTNPADAGIDQTLTFKIKPTAPNGFANLYLSVLRLDPDGLGLEDAVNPDAVDGSGNFVKTGVKLDEYHLTDTALTRDDNGNAVFDLSGPLDVTLGPGESVTYQFILYIKNLKDNVSLDQNNNEVYDGAGNQTDVDSNKTFAAAVIVEPSGQAGQIYGVISSSTGNFTG